MVFFHGQLVSRVNAAGIPLKAHEDLKAFKLFIVDVGLPGCMTGLRRHTLPDGNDLFVEFKGALTEQYDTNCIMETALIWTFQNYLHFNSYNICI